MPVPVPVPVPGDDNGENSETDSTVPISLIAGIAGGIALVACAAVVLFFVVKTRPRDVTNADDWKDMAFKPLVSAARVDRFISVLDGGDMLIEFDYSDPFKERE